VGWAKSRRQSGPNQVAKLRRANRPNGDRQWKRYYDMYQGSHWFDYDSDSAYLSSDNVRDHITVNKTGSIILNMVPFLVNGQIKFLLKPRRPQDVDGATVKQSLLNYTWREKNMTRQVKKAVYDACIIGHGIVKTAYAFDVDDSVDPDSGATLTYESFVRQDEPYIERVNPFYFIFDPQAPGHDLETARWCCEMFFRPLPDVLADPRYNEEAKDMIRGGSYAPAAVTTRSPYNQQPPTNPSPFNAYDSILPEDNLVILFKVYDKRFKKEYVFADNVPKPLIERPWQYDYLDNFPYQMIPYIPIPNEHYPIGIPKWIEDQQYELNRVRTSRFEHRRRFNRKYIAVTGQIDEEEAEKFIDGEDGTVVFGKSTGAIAPIDDAKMSSDTDITEANINSDIMELTGMDSLLRGGALPSRTTSGEVSTRASLFRMKLDDRVAAVEESVEEIASQVLKHIEANFLVEKVVEIVGPMGSEWKTATPEMIRADVDVEVESFSAPKIDEAIERQQWLQLLQLGVQAQPLVQQGQLQIDYNQLFKRTLEKFNEQGVAKFFPGAFGTPTQQGLPQGMAQRQIPNAVPQPGEGLTAQDLRQGIQGGALVNNGFQGGASQGGIV
jgi:hypothetical protein